MTTGRINQVTSCREKGSTKYEKWKKAPTNHKEKVEKNEIETQTGSQPKTTTTPKSEGGSLANENHKRRRRE